MTIGKESFKYALKNILHRKMRTFLTILSIFVGITTIFIFVSFGLGLYNYVDEFTTGTSADKLTIMPVGIGAPGLDDTFALTKSDIRAIDRTKGVYEVSGLYAKVAEAESKDVKKFVFIIGSDPDIPLIFEISNIEIEKGRMLRKGEKGKAVLGYNYMVEDKIFPKALEINDEITIQGEDVKIIGFMESIGNPQDDSQIYVTNDYMEDLYPNISGFGWVMARVDANDLEATSERVENSLRKSRDIEEGKEDFYVQSWQDMMETYSMVLNSIIGFVILIALIAVVVSAINTANTMVTSVLERIREIGIMKAVGAKNSEIFNIFLIESSLLGFFGGIVGILLGWGASAFGGWLLDNLGWSFLSPSYSWIFPYDLFLYLIIFATLTGAISGAIPAYRASKINPVEALRYE